MEICKKQKLIPNENVRKNDSIAFIFKTDKQKLN